MKFVYATFLTAFAFTSNALAEQPVEPAGPEPARLECADWSKEKWLEFRQTFVDENYSSGGVLAWAGYDYFGKLVGCAESLERTGLGSCFANLKDHLMVGNQMFEEIPYVGPESEGGTRTVGSHTGYRFEGGDKAYVENLPPEIFQYPVEFNKEESSEWVRIAKEKKIPYVEYDSSIDGHRFVFLEKTERYNRYTLLTSYNSLDIILVERDRPKPKIYFVESRRHQGDYATTGIPVVHNSTMTCTACHQGGPRGIFPVGGLTSEPIEGLDAAGETAEQVGKKRLALINKEINGTPAIDWSGQIKMDKFGPPINENSVMNCVACHDGQRKNFLTPSSWSQVSGKVHRDNDHGPMPPGRNLTEEQKSAVMRELEASHLPKMREWLLQPCQ